MILVMMLVSIGGCCIGRGGRGGEHHRDGGYERDDGHDMRNTINSLREKVTPDIIDLSLKYWIPEGNSKNNITRSTIAVKGGSHAIFGSGNGPF